MLPAQASLDDLLRRMGQDVPGFASKMRELIKLMDTIGVTDEVVPINLGVPGSSDDVTGWRTALDLNLTQDANFTFVDGANTWHGIPVTGVNITSAADTFAVQNGTGLVINPNATSTDWNASTNTAPRIELSVTDLIDGYLIGSTKVRAWVQWTVSGADANTENAGWGFNSPFVSNNYDRWTMHKGFIGGVSGVFASFVAGSSISATAISGGSSNNVGLIELDSGRLVKMWSKDSSSPLTDPNSSEFVAETMPLRGMNRRPVGTDTDFTTMRYSTASDMRLSLTAYPVNTSNSFSATFQRLRVEYKL